MLDIELDDMEDLDDIEVIDACKFEGCRNAADGSISITDGRSTGQARCCESCFEKYKTTRPTIEFYSCGRRLFIEKIYFT